MVSLDSDLEHAPSNLPCMPTPTDTTAPLRGASVGVLSATVTAAAHTFGGGMFPSEAALVLLCLVCAAVGYLATTLRVSNLARTRLMITLAAAQFVGHSLLTVVDGHHHGPVIGNQMLVAHAVAVIVGAITIRGAEVGIRRAISSLRRMLPATVPLVVDESHTTPTPPVYRTSASPRLLDLSGSGNRGPPPLFV